MDFTIARGVADAVFYEGYLLYPYTATSHKNKMRWQFGIVIPKAHEAAATGEHGHQQTDILFEATGDARIEVIFRFLHVESRSVEAIEGATFVPVSSLTVDGTQHLTFDESIEREVAASYRPAAEAPVDVAIRFDGARKVEELRDAAGALAGRIVRERWPVSGVLSIAAMPLGMPGRSRLRVRVENDSAVVAASERGVVMRTAFVSAHTLIGMTGGAFFSPIDPPEPELAAKELANEHTWPVLVGDAKADAQRAAIVLSSPIVLADFPEIAKKTDSDAFDATEIDELLTLSVLSLSDAERAEARATDPRARAIVERAEAFGAPDIDRLHASFETVSNFDTVPTFETVPTFGSVKSLAESVAPTSVTVGGTIVSKGSSVRLAPKRRADAWDMFLVGKIATVQAIHQDFEDRVYVAVTIDDDPATEYHQWYGRAFFFEPDEVEPLGASA